MMGELVEGQVVDRERRGEEESEGQQVDVKTDQKSAGGVGLVVDYGDERAFDNSFRVSRRATGSRRGESSRLTLGDLTRRPFVDTRLSTYLMTLARPT